MGRFSPDGSTVAFMRWSRDGVATTTLEAKVVGAEGSQVLAKPDPDWPVVIAPSFSPDGRWIAFYARRVPFEDPTSIRVIPRVGGESRQIAGIHHMTYGESGPAWTLDGKWLFSQDRAEAEKAFHIALVSVETGEKRRLTHPPPDLFGDSGTALSPDGRTLIYTQCDAETSDLMLVENFR
jgi:Tol biopolymer transport system component